MGWDAVFHLALKQYGAESIELRIVIGLVLALAALMILIGLRHAFKPAGPRFASPPPELPKMKRVKAAAPAPVLTAAPIAAAKSAPQPFRLRKPELAPPRKRVKEAAPKTRRDASHPVQAFHRLPSFTEAHTRYTPLPPRR